MMMVLVAMLVAPWFNSSQELIPKHTAIYPIDYKSEYHHVLEDFIHEHSAIVQFAAVKLTKGSDNHGGLLK